MNKPNPLNKEKPDPLALAVLAGMFVFAIFWPEKFKNWRRKL